MRSGLLLPVLVLAGLAAIAAMLAMASRSRTAAVPATPSIAASPTAPPATPAAPAEPGFTPATLARLDAAVPSPLFRAAPQERLPFEHVPDPKLRAARADVEVPVGLEGGGVAVGDWDGDGADDLFLAGGGGGRLYRNVSGAFEDATEAAGLHLAGESRAPFFVDFDNDGDADLFLTFVEQSCRLYENGGSKLRDVTRESGLEDPGHVSHGAVWFDMDNDGLLDLYVARFGRWTHGLNLKLYQDNTNAEPNVLYHQLSSDGKHRFEEIGVKAGVADTGWTHAVGAWDYDGDGFQDLFAINDFGSSHAYRNQGDRTFRDVSKEIHFVGCYNGMNFTLFDPGSDGRFALYVSEITTLTESQSFLASTSTARPLPIENANKLFRETSSHELEEVQFRIFEPVNTGWAWDASAFDYENDGDPDVLVVNGTEEEPPTLPGEARPAHVLGRNYVKHYARERKVFYVNEGGYFYDMSRRLAPAGESGVGSSRGAAYLDVDGDGDLDLVINNYAGAATLLLNQQSSGSHWIRLRLVGTKSSRDPAGARVSIRAGGRTQYGIVTIGSGFLSQKPIWLHFGVGVATKVDRVDVKWPSGGRQSVSDLAVDRLHVIKETAVPASP
ncbi:MAG: CRTAC1 family protein [Acidobacteriota bacterium]